MNHTAFFGDATYTFALTTPMILELERKTGVGIAALYARFMRQEFHFSDMIEIIRTGLIGAGTSPVEAQTLVDTYAKPRPVMEVLPLAFDILDARWNGTPEAPATPDLGEMDETVFWTNDELEDDAPAPAGTKQAAATSDLAAAVNDALKQVAE